jgi:hypothetical protein
VSAQARVRAASQRCLPVVGDALDLGPAGGLVLRGEGVGAGGAAGVVPGAGEEGGVAGAGGDGVAARLEGEAGGGGGGGDREAAEGEGPAAGLDGGGGQRGEQRGHVGEAVGGLEGEAATEGGEDAIGDAGVGWWRAQAALQDVAGEDAEAVAEEGALAEQGLPQGAAEAELVGAWVDGFGEELLGGHVRGGAEEHAGGGEVEVGVAAGGVGEDGGLVGELVRVAGGGAGDAEVEDAGAEDAGLDGDEDVVGFEVAVDEAGAVGGGEALAGLAVDGDDGGPSRRRGRGPRRRGWVRGRTPSRGRRGLARRRRRGR